jgi:hypothetical protein
VSFLPQFSHGIVPEFFLKCPLNQKNLFIVTYFFLNFERQFIDRIMGGGFYNNGRGVVLTSGSCKD